MIKTEFLCKLINNRYESCPIFYFITFIKGIKTLAESGDLILKVRSYLDCDKCDCGNNIDADMCWSRFADYMLGHMSSNDIEKFLED